MGFTYAFEKLEVWKRSINLVKEIYTITAKFPSFENFNLRSQMNRSAVSISSNLAEGSSRKSTRDQAHFYNMAYSSTIEITCELRIAEELGYIDSSTHYHKIHG